MSEALTLADSEDPLNRSPEVVGAAASERSELEVRYDRVRELLAAYQRADVASAAWFTANRTHKFPHDSEEEVRAEVEKRRLVAAWAKARDAYHAACDEFFAAKFERPIRVAFGAPRQTEVA